ncbi:MAG: hypothetical protein ABIG95_02855 [Candidatus Woesearchaeota archaeon]
MHYGVYQISKNCISNYTNRCIVAAHCFLGFFKTLPDSGKVIGIFLLSFFI